MKIIISPAKSLNFQKELPIKDFSIPLFLNDSCVINESLRLHSPKELKNLMGISEKLADLKKISFAEIKNITTDNFNSLFFN